MNYFITAIGTDSGKTLVSAIFCEALGADYWKPVQAGLPRDLETVRALVSNPSIKFHDEAYRLNTPASPHAAARIDGISIDLHSIRVPEASGDLVIEGAGGILVPLNDKNVVIDIVQVVHAKVVLVSNLYLGSINHTLLSYEALQSRNLTPIGIVFNGIPNPESERIILHHTRLKCLLNIHPEKKIDKHVIKKYAALLKPNLA